MIQAPPTDIVVTATRLAPGRGEDAFGPVILGRERLSGSASNRLEDVLRDVPGFQLFRRSDARSANPTSQGATLRALGGNASSRALLVLDGVSLTDPFGGWISWPALDPRRLGEVRVTRGGGTGAFGPGALAGTIALTSLSVQDGEGLRAQVGAGSRGSFDGFAGYGARLGSGFGHASLSYARGDGFVPVIARQRGPADRLAPYEQVSLSLRGAAPIGSTAELQASMLAFTDARERGTAFSAIRTRGADASLSLIGSGTLPFAVTGYVQLRDFANAFASVNDARTAATQTLDQYSVPATGLGLRGELRPSLGPIELRLGGDLRLSEGESRELYQFVAGAPTRGRVAGGRSLTTGVFAEAGYEDAAWTLSGGFRLDLWRITQGSLSENVLATGATLTDLAYPTRSGTEPTARAAAAYRVSDAVTLRAAAYRGWRLPTLNELYRPFRLGPDATAANPDLAPERLDGVEAGLELRAGRIFRVSATLFHNRLSDAIGNVTLASGPGTFPGVGFVSAAGQYRQRRNLDAIASTGVELDGRLDLGAWTLSAGYAFADAHVEATGAATALNGLRPAQTPRHSASATASWQQRGAAASLTVRYVSAQFEDDLNRQSIPDALTLDATAELPLTASLALQARAENLFDEEVVAGITSAGTVERATPRTIWLGLTFRD